MQNLNIPAEQPTLVPPQEGKTYPHLWVSNLEIVADDTQTGALSATFSPYNADTGDILNNKSERFATNDLWLLVGEVPEAANAMKAIAESVPAIRAWIKSKQ